MRSISHTEKWKCDKATNSITVTKIHEESGVVGHPRCKAQHCKAVCRIFRFIIKIHNGEETRGKKKKRKRER
jgi:predicted nucleic acid-binding Zn ribbon protein